MNRFAPELCSETPDPAFEFIQDEETPSMTPWIPVLRCPTNFPADLFETAAVQMVEHPEYNSTLILRSETVSDTNDPEKIQAFRPHLKDLSPVRNVHRRLLPRRPGRDELVEQHCTFYAKGQDKSSVLVLSPIVAPGSELPYYHPAVDHLALRYVPRTSSSSEPSSASNADSPAQPEYGEIQVLVIPHDPPSARDPSSRLHRTCRALLEAIHRYGWGALTAYRKRVQHDRLVPRETYQDLYLVMRERHKGLVNTWVEGTDPLKHVFEVKKDSFDIGIATFLILLWRDMFGDGIISEEQDFKTEPWKTWPRPPGGYLDLGCGNGLLVHILTLEGYAGAGIDVRARQSWTTYGPETRARLHVSALDPTGPLIEANEPWWQPGVFIVANHADELTPWTPVLATLRNASGYLSIPCCAWTFDERFHREGSRATRGPWGFLFDNLRLMGDEDADPEDEEAAFVEHLGLGGDANASASGYSAYRIWLAKLALACGWNVECDVLRIPSTRNWAILGRERTGDHTSAQEKLDKLVHTVRERGLFKTRRPEGKAGDH